MKWKYKHRPPFLLYLRLSRYELENIDYFLELVKDTQRSKSTFLEQLASSKEAEDLDDWLVDDFAQLDDFSTISTEFAILGLWRCVEMNRKRAVRIAFGDKASKSVFRNKDFKKQLLSINIKEERIRCARSVDELRCLNNAIKHEQRVSVELSGFHRWKKKQFKELGELRSHYSRLRPLTERYLEDFTNRLCYWWIKNA